MTSGFYDVPYIIEVLENGENKKRTETRYIF